LIFLWFLYQNVTLNYEKIAGSKFNKGHIRIDDENPVVGKVPYVFGQTECGQPGQYMHLTTYLLYAGSFAGFGEIGKNICVMVIRNFSHHWIFIINPDMTFVEL
jgi:hypothetical protein